jgi:hypothetical protein
LCIWKSNNDNLCKSTNEDEGFDAGKQNKTLKVERLNSVDRQFCNRGSKDCGKVPECPIVIAEEDVDTEYDLVEQLDPNICKHEGNPGVDLGRTFSDLVVLVRCKMTTVS